jgi:hypothetical protein
MENMMVNQYGFEIALVQNPYGGFHKWGCPIAGWFLVEHPIKIYDLGVPTILGKPHIVSEMYSDILTKQHIAIYYDILVIMDILMYCKIQ